MKTYKVRKVEINGQFVNTEIIELGFILEQKCRELINLAELKEWEIFAVEDKNSLNEEVIDRSLGYKAFLLKEVDDRAAWLKKQHDKTNRINALPKTFKSNIAFPAGVVLEHKRSEARFDSRISSKIRWDLKEVLTIDGVTNGFYSDDYVTRDHKIQMAKFARDMDHLFGSYVHRVNPEIIKEIIAERGELKKSIEDC